MQHIFIMGPFPKNFFAMGAARKVFLGIEDIIRHVCPHQVKRDWFESIVTEETSGAKQERIEGEIIVVNDLDHLSWGLIESDEKYFILTIVSPHESSFSGEYLTVLTDCPCDKKSVMSPSKIEGIIAEYSEFF